jgi:LysM repeat protein
MHKLTVAELKTLNNLTDNIIEIGQKLKVKK